MKKEGGIKEGRDYLERYRNNQRRMEEYRSLDRGRNRHPSLPDVTRERENDKGNRAKRNSHWVFILIL